MTVFTVDVLVEEYVVVRLAVSLWFTLSTIVAIVESLFGVL